MDLPNIGYLAQPAVRDRRAMRLASQNLEEAARAGSPKSIDGTPTTAPMPLNDACYDTISAAAAALLDANLTGHKKKAVRL